MIALDRQDRSDRDRAWQIVCPLPGVRRLNALIGLSVLSGLTAVADRRVDDEHARRMR